MSKPRNWQAAFDALGGLGAQFGPGGRDAMTDDDCKAVVMAQERAVKRAEAGLPEPKSHHEAFARLDRACRRGVAS